MRLHISFLEFHLISIFFIFESLTQFSYFFHPSYFGWYFEKKQNKKAKKIFLNFSGRYFLSVLGFLTNWREKQAKQEKKEKKKSLKKVSTSTATVLHCDIERDKDRKFMNLKRKCPRRLGKCEKRKRKVFIYFPRKLKKKKVFFTLASITATHVKKSLKLFSLHFSRVLLLLFSFFTLFSHS